MTTVPYDPVLAPLALLQQFPVQLPVSVDVLVVLAVVVALVLFIFQPVSIDTTAIALIVVLILLGPWTGSARARATPTGCSTCRSGT